MYANCEPIDLSGNPEELNALKLRLQSQGGKKKKNFIPKLPGLKGKFHQINFILSDSTHFSLLITVA